MSVVFDNLYIRFNRWHLENQAGLQEGPSLLVNKLGKGWGWGGGGTGCTVKITKSSVEICSNYWKCRLLSLSMHVFWQGGHPRHCHCLIISQLPWKTNGAGHRRISYRDDRGSEHMPKRQWDDTVQQAVGRVIEVHDTALCGTRVRSQCWEIPSCSNVANINLCAVHSIISSPRACVCS